MEKEKRPYSLLSNVAYALKTQWSVKRSTLLFCALAVVTSLALTFLGMLMPKAVVDQLEGGVSASRFVLVVGGIAGLLVIVNYLDGYATEIYINSVGTIGSFSSPSRAMAKTLDMDYALLEDPGVIRLQEKASRASRSNHTPAHNIARTLVKLSINVLSFLLYGTLLISIHPLLLALIALSGLVNWLFLSASRRYEASKREELSTIQTRLYYIINIAKTAAAAKDIRLYRMDEWIRALFDKDLRAYDEEHAPVASRAMRTQCVEAVMALLRDGAAYAFLISLLLAGSLTLGDFLFAFAAVGSFAGWVSGILLELSDLLRASEEMSDIRVFLDHPDRFNRGPGPALPDKDQSPGISVQSVSYTYPEAKKATLEDISFDIAPGERIAIVGINGAGKTTLVKLICGLYHPDAGRIILGDHDMTAYNRDAYYELFATVFQDIHLLSVDISGNVSQQPPEQTDDARVAQCLQMAGLYDKVQSLPAKEKTLLVRELNDDAIVLSGGEMQKLAMARALYKDASLIILDEPTAALDPIAESEVYQRYADMTRGKTAIFISHRLASTRFCDRILFLENGAIVEQGSHEALMRLGGRYAHMFAIQAQYYQEEKEGNCDA